MGGCGRDSELLFPEFQNLARAGRWNAFASRLAEEGLSWWFEMDVPAIGRHLEALGRHRPSGWSPRLMFLKGAVSPLPASRGPKDVLRDITLLYRVFQVQQDVEAVAGVCGLAVAAAWDFGVEWSRCRPWLERIESLSEHPRLSPLARASVLAFRALMHIFHSGDLESALRALEDQRTAAEEARSAAMTLFGATLQAMALAYAGRTERAVVVLEETSPFLGLASPTSYTCLYHAIMYGIVLCTANRPADAYKVLRPVGEGFPPEHMRVSVSLLLLGARLLAASLARHVDDLPLLEANVRQLAVGEQVHFFAALMHFSVGTYYLRAGRPYKALVHAERGERAALRAESFAAAAMNQILQAQALADLNEKDDAAARLDQAVARCREKNFLLFVEGAALERAALMVERGETERARGLLDEIRGLLPPGRPLLSAFRPPEFTQAVLARAGWGDGPEVRGPGWDPDPDRPVRICALGGFSVTMLGHTVYDRRWKSSRTQQLLKLLLALGGEKVPVDHLVEFLWPDAAGDQGRANLKTALARLRRVGLPEGAEPVRWLHLRHGRLSLSRSVVFADVLAFEAAVQEVREFPTAETICRALDLYKGDFLPGDNTFGVIESRREEFRRHHVRLVEHLVELEKQGRFQGDLGELVSQALAANPSAERLYVLKMEHLLRRGYPVEAIRTFRQAESYFRNAFGVRPGTELRRLVSLARRGRIV